MAAWQRRLLELFPDLRIEINHADSSLYLIFGELVHRALAAHQTNDEVTLGKLYGFAAWCNDSRSFDLWNPVGVSFYEHLFDHSKDRALWADIAHWVGPRIADDVWGLWEWRLTPEEMAELRKVFAKQASA
jgi:hypothetical protein